MTADQDMLAIAIADEVLAVIERERRIVKADIVEAAKKVLTADAMRAVHPLTAMMMSWGEMIAEIDKGGDLDEYPYEI